MTDNGAAKTPGTQESREFPLPQSDMGLILVIMPLRQVAVHGRPRTPHLVLKKAAFRLGSTRLNHREWKAPDSGLYRSYRDNGCSIR